MCGGYGSGGELLTDPNRTARNKGSMAEKPTETRLEFSGLPIGSVGPFGNDSFQSTGLYARREQ